MNSKTRVLWKKQDQHKGDRWRLFQAVSTAVPAQKVLYPGSYVDVAPSFVFGDVTYSDMDKRAAMFFADEKGVQQIISEHNGGLDTKMCFVPGDYNTLTLKEQSFDLLVSLYAGFISEPCGKFLRIGGTLLVNPSHGDAALAALDERFDLVGVVTSSKGNYKISNRNLETYMIPKKPQSLTRDSIIKWGRGIGYTKAPFAYLFRRVI